MHTVSLVFFIYLFELSPCLINLYGFHSPSFLIPSFLEEYFSTSMLSKWQICSEDLLLRSLVDYVKKGAKSNVVY